MLKKMNRIDNFKLWFLYNEMSSINSALIKFIDNDILDYDPVFFKKLFIKAENAGEIFYTTLKKSLNLEKEIKFNIDFVNQIYEIETIPNIEFNKREFLFNSLDLFPQYRKKVEEILKNEEY